jgi:hypothetical protein
MVTYRTIFAISRGLIYEMKNSVERGEGKGVENGFCEGHFLCVKLGWYGTVLTNNLTEPSINKRSTEKVLVPYRTSGRPCGGG